jgi:hypothetical protein
VSRKHFYLGTSSILLNDDIKMSMVHLDMLEMFVILQLKKYQGDVLEQDVELCPFCYFPVTIAVKEEATFFVTSFDFTLALFFDFLFY